MNLKSLTPVYFIKPKTRCKLIGVDDAEGSPVPIPNTEVKLSGAEDSAPETGCENREMPILVTDFIFIYAGDTMKSAKINNELMLSYDEGFSEMSADELKKYFSSVENRWGIFDKDNHILISVSWTNPGFINYLTDSKAVVRGALRCSKSSLINFRIINKQTLTVDSKKAYCVAFEYKANDADINMYAELLAFRQKNKFYAIHYLSRREFSADNRKLFDSVIKSIKINP